MDHAPHGELRRQTQDSYEIDQSYYFYDPNAAHDDDMPPLSPLRPTQQSNQNRDNIRDTTSDSRTTSVFSPATKEMSDASHQGGVKPKLKTSSPPWCPVGQCPFVNQALFEKLQETTTNCSQWWQRESFTTTVAGDGNTSKPQSSLMPVLAEYTSSSSSSTAAQPQPELRRQDSDTNSIATAELQLLCESDRDSGGGGELWQDVIGLGTSSAQESGDHHSFVPATPTLEPSLEPGSLETIRARTLSDGILSRICGGTLPPSDTTEQPPTNVSSEQSLLDPCSAIADEEEEELVLGIVRRRPHEVVHLVEESDCDDTSSAEGLQSELPGHSPKRIKDDAKFNCAQGYEDRVTCRNDAMKHDAKEGLSMHTQEGDGTHASNATNGRSMLEYIQQLRTSHASAVPAHLSRSELLPQILTKTLSSYDNLRERLFMSSKSDPKTFVPITVPQYWRWPQGSNDQDCDALETDDEGICVHESEASRTSECIKQFDELLETECTNSKMKQATEAYAHNSSSDVAAKLIRRLYNPELFLPLGTKLPQPRDTTFLSKLACQAGVKAPDEGSTSSKWVNRNAHLTGPLEELEAIYKALGDTWRSFTFRRVASLLKQLDYTVEREEQVHELASRFRGLGKKTAAKLIEILRNLREQETKEEPDRSEQESSRKAMLQRLEQLHQRADVKAVFELTKIHGVGAKLALKWHHELGVQNLSDVKYLVGDLDEDFIGSDLEEELEEDTLQPSADRTDLNSTISMPGLKPSQSIRSSAQLSHVSATVLSKTTSGTLNGKLSRTQSVGLTFVEDTQRRIPRSEVEAIKDYIERVVRRISPQAVVICCGSYRRGAESSGDVDILISHTSWVSPLQSLEDRVALCMMLLVALQVCNSDSTNTEPFTPVELNYLQELALQFKQGVRPECLDLPASARPFLTGTLTSSQPKLPAQHQKCEPQSARMLRFEADGSVHERTFQCNWSGYCKLPKWHPNYSGFNRRLDIKFYAFPHLPYATLYFTGSDHFNRSMRYYAKQMGWSLSDTGLRPTVRTKGASGVRVTLGKSIFALSEKDIFDAMGLTYVPPHLRNTYYNVVPL